MLVSSLFKSHNLVLDSNKSWLVCYSLFLHLSILLSALFLHWQCLKYLFCFETIVPTLFNLISIFKWIQAKHESLLQGFSIPELFIFIHFLFAEFYHWKRLFQINLWVHVWDLQLFWWLLFLLGYLKTLFFFLEVKQYN